MYFLLFILLLTFEIIVIILKLVLKNKLFRRIPMLCKLIEGIVTIVIIASTFLSIRDDFYFATLVTVVGVMIKMIL